MKTPTVESIKNALIEAIEATTAEQRDFSLAVTHAYLYSAEIQQAVERMVSVVAAADQSDPDEVVRQMSQVVVAAFGIGVCAGAKASAASDLRAV